VLYTLTVKSNREGGRISLLWSRKLICAVSSRAGVYLGLIAAVDTMKRFTKAAHRTDRSRGRRVPLVALFGLLVPWAVAQNAQQLIAGVATPVQAGSTLETANFVDVTSALGITFEYVASHTSKKYLIETMGSGVACLTTTTMGV
jgi:hypothetical protein